MPAKHREKPQSSVDGPQTMSTHLVSLRQKIPVSFSKGVFGDLFEDMRVLHKASA
jgi:hypothetical protein